MAKGPNTNDSIGDRGEAIFKVAITKRNGRAEPLFKVVHLGEKFKGLDFYIELNRRNGKIRPFFFVQAKATNRKVSKRNRLFVTVKNKSLNYILKYPAPVFLVGIHEESEKAFISGIWKSKKSISSITTQFDISTEIVQLELYDQVLNYWNGAAFRTRVSCFR